MLAASMIKAADSCADSFGTASSPAAYQTQSGRIIAFASVSARFAKYHAATRYQSVFLLPLVTFGT